VKLFISIWLVFLFLVFPPLDRFPFAFRRYLKENGGVKTIKVRRTENRVFGSPWNELEIIVPGGDNFGRDPDIIVFPNSDNTVTIAWLDKDNERIHISQFNDRDSLTGEVSNKNFCMSNTRLAGFCKIPGDNSMVLGYSKPNKSKDGDDFRIMRLKQNGDSLWDKKIFGSNSMKKDYARCCPGSGGTSRIVYNPVTKNIGFFLGHSLKNPDGITHQASYLGFISAAGKRLKTGDDWYISHDMDQRMIVRDSLYYLLSHGVNN